MNLLLVHNFYRSHNVGGEDLVFRDEYKRLSQTLGENSVHAYSVSNDQLTFLKVLFSIFFSPWHFFCVLRLVKKKKINLVHVHNFFPLLSPSVFLAARLGGAKVVHTLHSYRSSCISGLFFRKETGVCELCANKVFPISGMKFACYRESVSQSILAQCAFSFYRVFGFWTWVDRFFVLTEFQKNKMIGLGIRTDKLTLKPNGVELGKNSSPGRDGFLFIGRLETAKGIDVLLNAWRELSPSLTLTVIGDSERLDGLRKKFNRPNIKFLGNVSREEVLNEISRSKFLIHPSIAYETFGLTIVEALGAGTPVIGFNIGTRPEFIQNEVNGFICSPSALTETLDKAAKWESYSEMSLAARKSAERFQAKVITIRQIQIYETILSRTPKK